MKTVVIAFAVLWGCLAGCATSKMVYKKDDLKIVVTQPKETKFPSTVSISETGDVSYTAPISFSPTETQTAKALADVFKTYHVAAVACVLLAAFLFWKTHFMGGIFSILAGAGLVVFAEMGQNKTALNVVAFSAGCVFAFVSAWYIIKNRFPAIDR